MAIDQVEKRRGIARQAVQLAPALMDVLYALDALRRKRDMGGNPLVFADSDFTGVTGLAHIDKASIDAFFNAVPTILSAFASNNFDDVFEVLRP